MPLTDPHSGSALSTWRRILRTAYAALGLLVLGLGLVGFAVPGLPGTPLLLVSAWLFSMSNDRLYRWMVTNRCFGQVITDYRAGLGISRRMKQTAVASMSVVVTLSIVFGIDDPWLRIAVALLGLSGIVFVLTRPTSEVDHFSTE